jgi:Tfp pilus tip-associated adhesin PilY1
MKRYLSARSLFAALAAAMVLGAPIAPAGAAPTDLSSVPLGTSSSTAVLPNLMFILDDSGSMAREHMPDELQNGSACKVCTSSSSCNVAGTSCVPGHAPYYASRFNTIYYNPQITYSPGVDGNGASLGNATPTAANNDPYITGQGTRNLVTTWTETVWCDSSSRSGADLTNPAFCKRNGIDTPAAGWAYDSINNASPFAGGFPVTGFRNAKTLNTNPHYFDISPREHCSDENLVDCTLSATPVAGFTVPAPVRWCKSSSGTTGAGGAGDVNAVSGTSGTPATPKCQSKVDSAYQFPRLGTLKRTDIVPATANYPRASSRSDCTGPVGPTGCSYAQELQNFANWYSYYRSRMLTMKSSAGRVFKAMDDRYRIGFVTINASSSARYLKIDKFDVTHKANWYAKFYAQTPSSGTPLREALSRVGRHYAGVTSGINSFMPEDPIQYSCQQNFALLTTDGYWNNNAGQNLTGGGIGDQDDVESATDPKYVSRTSGTLDGGGTQVTTVTRVTEREHVRCTANTTANFSGSPDVSCGCASGQQAIRRRTRDMDQTVVATDGVAGAATYGNPGSSTFDYTTACQSPTTPALTPPATTYTPTGAAPTVTTTPGGTANTLADVAMYYYKTDLRTSGAVSKNNVPGTTKDFATHQHMVTFTLGLGLDGLMNYRSDYETATSGDFKKIKDGVTGCPFSPGGTAAVCNWPVPVEDTPTALDDLWHAAVNGRGTYFSAKDPNQLESGLTSALQAIKVTTGAAASSATSTPNVTPTDNFIYSSTYRTVKWDGEVIAEKIDVVTGSIIPGIAWSVNAKLNPRTLPTSDDRKIYTFDKNDSTDKLKEFRYTALAPSTEQLSSTERAFFDNHCTLNPTVWPQCGAMSPPDLAIANSGNNLVNFLRGQKQHELIHFRVRENALGDTVNAKPAFLGKPNLLYGDAVVPDYNSFKSGPAASRTPVLFIAANDGMLHAIHGGEDAAGGGSELWAYVPRMLHQDLFKLAARNYDVNHRFYVDGSPVTMDVFIGGAWKTILVGGLNAGGRGYYALDVTDTSAPKGLWEVCADPTGTRGCADNGDKDDNIGYTYGQPIITKDPKDGKWVVIVSSGYNNISPGDGKGYIFIIDAETGLIKDKATTNVGDTVTPSGFAKISGFATNFSVNNTTTLVYGGDLFGNVWRFDVENRVFQRIGQTLDAAGKPQSITTRPEITRFDAGFNVVYVATGRFLGASDIPDPATLVPPLNVAYQQSVYGFKDTGANLGSLREPAAGLVQQVMSVIDATSRTISNNAVDWSTKNGWWVDLNPAGDSPGERVNIDIQLVRGVLLVDANEPNNDACSSGGNSFFYQFDYQSGSYLASSPGQVVGIKIGAALAAGFVVYRLPSGQLKYTGIDVTGAKTTGGVLPGSSGALGRRATWRELYQ